MTWINAPVTFRREFEQRQQGRVVRDLPDGRVRVQVGLTMVDLWPRELTVEAQ